MDWIKRNLFFVIGAAIALILMVCAGFYTWSGWSNNSAALEAINGKYEELKRLTNLNPNPGSGKVDNVKAAKEQEKQVQEVMAQVATRFEPILAIPAETNVTEEALASALSTTIHRLQLEATNAGIILPPRYNFSFDKQSSALKFAAGSARPLSVQLGEVSAIMEALIASKINSLESIQRERVSADDSSGPATDYIDQHTETNELALLSPYQITFRCFTPELSQVLCGFGGASRGIIIKSMNVEPSAMTYEAAAAAPMSPVYVPVAQPVNPINRALSEREAFNSRYGIGPRPVIPTAPTAVPQVAMAPAAPAGPQTVLDEKQLKVTMLVQVVKLLPKK